jgi:hypothetical protein
MNIFLVLFRLLKVFLVTFRETYWFFFFIQFLYLVFFVMVIAIVFNVYIYNIFYYLIDCVLVLHLFMGLRHILKDYVFDYKLYKFMLLIVNLLVIHVFIL